MTVITVGEQEVCVFVWNVECRVDVLLFSFLP